MDEKTIARFWSKVDVRGPAECWPWLGCRLPSGYGKVRFGRKSALFAHRVAYFIQYGRWPEPLCCHSCDNTWCVNPVHLFEGTHADNANDREAKGRTFRKLATNDVARIRFLAVVAPLSQIASEYGLCPSYVWRIVNDKVRVCGK